MTRRRKPHRPRPLMIPRLVQGFDLLASVRQCMADVRAHFVDRTTIVARQSLADLNMLWQQITKVHEYGACTTPPRSEILAAHNTLERLNADAEINLDEFNRAIATLEACIAATKHVPQPVWDEANTTLELKRTLHGQTGEHWFGGALGARKAA
jgi:hypothetical protein